MGLMGDLFGFAKEAGKRLFSRDAEAAEKIQAHIAEDNPGIEGMRIAFDDGVVSLVGKANSPEAMEKAVLMAGNVKGVTRVDVAGLETPEQPARIEYYIIESGDTLSGIAKKYYGNAMDYPKIFDANREVIKDPDLIYPGQKIRIPPK